MTTTTALVDRAYWLLQSELYGYLDAIEEYATTDTEWAKAEVDLARDLIPDLIYVLRTVVGVHQPGEDGKCAGCALAWPCEVPTVVHEMLLDPRLSTRQLALTEADDSDSNGRDYSAALANETAKRSA